MRKIYIEDIEKCLNQHMELLKMVGYSTIGEEYALSMFELGIIKNDKVVGRISMKRENLSWLKNDKKILANENYDNALEDETVFGTYMFHTVINDEKFKCDCYNIIGKDFIAFKNNKITIEKATDFSKIKYDDNNTKFIVNYPDRKDNDEFYNNIINNSFGYDVIENIESYYNDNIKHK